MEQNLEHVFVVHLKSTGETYEHIVCASIEAAVRVCKDRRITIQEQHSAGYWFYRDAVDPSQSAMIVRNPLVTR